MWMKTLGVTVTALALSNPALAHSGAHPDGGFLAGLTHPLFGLDHLLAIVAVGLWAALSEPSRFWVAPAGFLVGMLASMFLALSGFAILASEGLILLSVVLFGTLALFAARVQPLLAFCGAAVLASAHGAAHGLEAPALGSAIAFACGVMLMTALLMSAGTFAGRTARNLQVGVLGRLAGGALATAGLIMVAS